MFSDFYLAVVFMILVKSVKMSKWISYRLREAQAASKERQFVRWRDNNKINKAHIYHKLARTALADWQGEKDGQRNPRPVNRLFVSLIWTNDSHRIVLTEERSNQSRHRKSVVGQSRKNNQRIVANGEATGSSSRTSGRSGHHR
jgi:hypothetical protein